MQMDGMRSSFVKIRGHIPQDAVTAVASLRCFNAVNVVVKTQQYKHLLLCRCGKAVTANDLCYGVKRIPLCIDMPMAMVENTTVQMLDKALMKRRECRSGS